jgi:hypothetical protein
VGSRSIIPVVIVALQMLATIHVMATHLRAADIQVERICGTLSFRITVIAYLNSSSSTRFGTNSQVYFGDGSFAAIPSTTATLRPDLGINISVATFTTTHSYSSNGVYTVTYIERDRSRGVLNIANSHDVPYVTFITIDTNPSYGCNNFPVLSVVPLDRACSGKTFFHNSGAYDIDGDSLSYEMSIPASGLTSIAVYDDPNKSKFYSNHATGNENKNGPPVFWIDAITGLLTFDAPGMQGEYNIAFKIIEWRKDESTGLYKKVSTTTRDMQLVVEECDNLRPELTLPANICVLAGTEINTVITGTDPDGHDVKIEAFSELTQLADDPAVFTPSPPVFTPSDPPAEMAVTWKTKCENVRQQPYRVVFKITDNPPDGSKLVSFKTLNIQVIAAAPEWNEASLDVVRLHGVLKWEEHTCPNAHTMQIWRKVDSYPYLPGHCDLGIPPHSGYNLIAEVPYTTKSFTDTNFGNGLAAGARYCYRLVAKVTDTKSYVSDEMCIGPVRADAPVITHVSVEKTSITGNIRVSWRSPFDIDKTQFPEPYYYEVYRANGFIGDTLLHKVGYVPDTTFLDPQVNSLDSVFNYRIVIYSKPQHAGIYVPVDTSASASSVRLSASPARNSIVLHWRDSVPWSNVVNERPYHLIYRTEGVDPEQDMQLYDSVIVTANGFTYTDTNVEEHLLYSYKVLTRGTYGNPAIAIQENFSQVISAYPENDLQPCTPHVVLQPVDCNRFLSDNTCSTNTFNNLLSWTVEYEPSCRADIVLYNIYASLSLTGEYELLKTLKANEYDDADLPSYARCYKVSAVDSRGIEGPLSDAFCNDNCPFYMLPNVFTPNSDGCNDVFTARYNVPEYTGSANECPPANPNYCPRFVESVKITIYNRWGNEVYTYQSDEHNSIYIDWNGRDNSGGEVSTGVYYFVADVIFNVLDPAQRVKELKGWVHLVR